MYETTPATGNTTQALATATGTQTVLTMKDLENLENSEAQHVKEKEELQQRCTQLEQDNMRLRVEKEGLREKVTALDYVLRMIMRKFDSTQISLTGAYC